MGLVLAGTDPESYEGSHQGCFADLVLKKKKKNILLCKSDHRMDR